MWACVGVLGECLKRVCVVEAGTESWCEWPGVRRVMVAETRAFNHLQPRQQKGSSRRESGAVEASEVQQPAVPTPGLAGCPCAPPPSVRRRGMASVTIDESMHDASKVCQRVGTLLQEGAESAVAAALSLSRALMRPPACALRSVVECGVFH